MKIKILFFIFLFLACSSAPSDAEIEARVEAAVNQALEENAKSDQPKTTTTQPTTTSTQPTTTTTQPTTTTTQPTTTTTQPTTTTTSTTTTSTTTTSTTTTTTTTTLGPVVYYVHNGNDDSPNISLSSPRVKIKEIGGNMGQYATCLFTVYNSNGSTEELLTFIDNYFVRRVFLPNVNTIYLGGFSSGCSNANIEISYDYQPQQGLTTDSNGYYYVYNTFGDSDDFVLPADFRVGMEGTGVCVLYLKDSKTHQIIETIVKSTSRPGFTRVNIGKETKVFLSTEGVTLACDDTVKLIFKP